MRQREVQEFFLFLLSLLYAENSPSYPPLLAPTTTTYLLRQSHTLLLLFLSLVSSLVRLSELQKTISLILTIIVFLNVLNIITPDRLLVRIFIHLYIKYMGTALLYMGRTTSRPSVLVLDGTDMVIIHLQMSTASASRSTLYPSLYYKPQTCRLNLSAGTS